ncbi:hypothetical protein MIND_01220800 [Mycena indigotica]|uniref:Secreted protein n=1 Tax=Mycena indigotica TaxID=2126181 RepID=A0A8H6S3W3_9AGAR|nr:uncharacterized protein MIND_01220800 [Mycena indigotica]KAF7291952.1 hypothetical protein MIND_01220800 [Mycena indigotica]
MRYVLFLFAVLCPLFGNVIADTNTTIFDTDPSNQYSNGSHTLPCLRDDQGNFLPGQAGCFNNGPKNCSAGAHIVQQKDATVSMKFKGSAIYLNSLLNEISNIYTVTMVSRQMLMVCDRAGALSCDTLFSKTGLDPAAEHEIRVSIKGLSPQRNTTLSNNDDFFVFWLDNFVVTTPSANASSLSAATGATSTPTATGAAFSIRVADWPMGIAMLAILLSI